uniref:Uncharacterized protein n=1 Tax=Mycena chlorophos TaxID=658473 RepID=A0ABQ0KZV8_MYCCL|nr:predicted protein [Mycena chlorophos]
MLQELIIEVRLAFTAPQYDFHKPTMSILNSLFLAHPSLTTVRWRPHFGVQVAETQSFSPLRGVSGWIEAGDSSSVREPADPGRRRGDSIPEFEGYFE